MTTEQSITRDEWHVESRRVTIFLSDVLSPISAGLWASLVGGPPEASMSQPRAGSFTEEGPLGSNHLILQATPGRIDLLLTPQPRDESVLSSLGQLSDPQEEFDRVVSKLVEIVQESVKRVALGLVLRYPVASREAGHRHLIKYMHNVKIDPDTSWDFLYQINRKQDVPLRDLSYRLNRLSKWSVGAIFRAQVSVGHGFSVQQISEPIYACRLELDMSTLAESENKIPKEDVADIIKLLFDQAKNIAHHGDVP